MQRHFVVSRVGAGCFAKGKRHKWMERPDEKIVGTIQLKKIQRMMKGYLASLEEQKREEAWRRQNECDVCL